VVGRLNEQSGADRASPSLGGGPYAYARFGNPTVDAVEAQLATVDGGGWTCLTASGMSAIDAALSALQPHGRGRPWMFPDELYPGTRSYAERVVVGLRGTVVAWAPVSELAAEDLSAFAGRLGRERPAVLFLESMSNPFLHEPALERLVAIAHEHDVAVVVDNTMATHVRCQPLALGADVVVTSATKYLGGHGDLMAGVVAGHDRELGERVRRYRASVGSILNPFDAYALGGYLESFALRFGRQSATAAELAALLAGRPEVAQVWYPAPAPGLPGGGVVTFRLRGATPEVRTEAVRAFLARTEGSLPYTASFGAIESSVVDLATLSGQPGSEGVLRLSVGLEDPHEIVEALDRGLRTTEGVPG
jgi:cystathionine beta-lyase/cystathionine gamma-synthase